MKAKSSYRTLLFPLSILCLVCFGLGGGPSARAQGVGANGDSDANQETEAPTTGPVRKAARTAFELGPVYLSLPREMESIKIVRIEDLSAMRLKARTLINARITGPKFLTVNNFDGAGLGDMQVALRELDIEDDVVDQLVKRGWAEGPARLEVQTTVDILNAIPKRQLFEEVFGNGRPEDGEALKPRALARQLVLDEIRASVWETEGPLDRFNQGSLTIFAKQKKHPLERGGLSMTLVAFDHEGEPVWSGQLNFSPGSSIVEDRDRILSFIRDLLEAPG